MELHIEFSGLCALVTPASPNDPFLVVLPLGSEDHGPHPPPHGPGGTHGGTHGGAHGLTPAVDPGLTHRALDTGGPHVPLLEMPGIDLYAQQNVYQQSGDKGGPLDLTGYELSILAGGVPLSGAPVMPAEEMAGNMTKLASSGRIQLAFIQIGRPLPPQISTRIVLAGGSITYGVTPAFSALWGFDPPVMEQGQPYRQRLSDTMTYTLSTSAGAIEVKLRRPKGGEERVFLLEDDASRGRTYHLKITNLPKRRVPQQTVNGRVMATHFHAFYDLLQAPPADPPLPVYEGPAPIDLDRENFCPLAVFEPPA